MAGIHALVATPDTQPDPIDSVDVSTIDFPDKTSPLEDAYHQTLGLHPDHAATVIRTANQLDQDPATVAANLEAAKQAASVPDTVFFGDLIKKNPHVSSFLADPRNMAVGKDDIHNLARTENLVQDYGVAKTMWNALNVGAARFNEQVAKLPATIYDVAAFPQNFIASTMGRPDLEVQSPEWLANNPVAKYYSEQAKAWTPPALTESVTDLLRAGRIGEASKALSAQLVESVPSLALLIGASAVGAPGVGLAGIGATSTADAMSRNRAMGIEPAPAELNAMYHGAITTAFMNLGALSPIHKWETAIAESVGQDTARKVALDMVKTLAGSFASMGGSMAAMSGGADFADYATGVNPNALQGSLKRAMDAMIVGGATGVAMVGPAAIAGGFGRSADVQRTQQAKDFYTALGDSAEASKMRQRMPEAHQAMIDQITKDGPVDSVYSPVNDFDAYFQSKKLNPQSVAADLGVGDQYIQAKETGGDLQIPLSTWTDKVVGTEHFAGMADDVKFHPEDMTPRQAIQRKELMENLVQTEADKAVAEDPALKEGHDFVYNDIKTKMEESGAYESMKNGPAVIDANAKLFSAVVTNEAKRAGLDPKTYYQNASKPIEVVGKGELGKADLSQANSKTQTPEPNIMRQEPLKDLPVVSEQAKIGEPYAVFAYNWKLSNDHPTIPYFRLYGDPQKINEMTKLPNNPNGNAWRSDVSLDTVKEARIQIRGRAPEAKDQPLFQDSPEDPRGFIRFLPEKTIIALTKADPSTFVHELAHGWLNNFHEFVQAGKAEGKYGEDWKILSKWLGVEEVATKITREQHETFARGFEAYMREGKAPSEGLRGVFSRFRKWLTRLYKDPAILGVNLTDDVRGVMDRMVASEDEIAFANAQSGMDIGRDISGLPPEVQAKIRDLADKAHEQAVSTLFRKQLKETTEEHKAFIATETDKARKAAEKEVAELPEQMAMDSVKRSFKKDAKTVATAFLNTEDPMKDRAKESWEVLANMNGFSSGDEMAKKIIASKTFDEEVKARIDAHMAQYADLKNSDKMREEAMLAIHNDKQTELMALERQAFQQLVDQARGNIAGKKIRQQEAKLEAATAKAKAAEIIASKPVKDAGTFMPFFTAERNAAMNVTRALADKNFEKAAEFKRQQMMNHALVKEAYNAKLEIDKAITYFERFGSRGADLKDMPYGFIRQIDALLSDRGLAPERNEDAATYLKIAQDMAASGADPEDIVHQTGWVRDDTGQWKAESLADTVARIQDDYRNLDIPDSVLTENPKDYKSMTMAEFRDLKTAVKGINAVARGYDRFLDENIKMDRKEAAAKVREFIEANIGTKYLENRMEGSKPGENKLTLAMESIKKLPDTITPSLVNLLSFCDFLDNGKPDGLMKNLVYRPLLHAENAKIRRANQAVGEMKDIIEQHWGKDYEKIREEKVFIQSRNREYTRDQLQAIANNWGTLAGRDRMTNGYKYTPEQLQEIFSNIPKRQWDYAQALWDYNDKYWPDIVALQQKVAGETPERVVPAEVVTPYGTYRGGYYHLAYDYSKSTEARQAIDARNALYKSEGAAFAHTDHGFTKSRVTTYDQPIRLDTRVEFTHIEDLIHDLSYRKAIVDVSSFLRQRDTREAIINAIGREGYDTIQKHVKWVASDQGQYLNSFTDNLIQRLRFGATIYTLGARPMTAPIFLVSNAISAVKDLGPMGFANSIRDFLSDREANAQFVNDKSARMTMRSTFMDRDLKDMDQRLQGNARLMTHFMFYPHQKADQAITYPLWLHVYKNALGEFGDKKASDIADEAVTKLAGSGSILDQAMIQRGTESQKVWSWWYSWAGTQFNRMWRDGKFAGLAYDKGNIGTALSIVGSSLFFGVGLQGANEAFWRDMVFRNTQSEDEDKKNKRMMMRMLMQGPGYIPIVREFTQYALEKSLGETADMKLPLLQSWETATDPLWEWAREKYTGRESPHFWEDTANAAGMVVNYPKYFNTLVFNFTDYLNDQGDLTWRDLFSRRTKT